MITAITLLFLNLNSVNAQTVNDLSSFSTAAKEDESLRNFNEGTILKQYESPLSVSKNDNAADSAAPGRLRGATSNNLSIRNTEDEKLFATTGTAGGLHGSSGTLQESNILIPSTSRVLSSHLWEREYPKKVPGYETNIVKPKAETKKEEIDYPQKVASYETNVVKPKAEKTTAKKRYAKNSQAGLMEKFRSQAGPPRNMCGLRLPEDRKVLPTWLSSFPESGAKISWRLIEAVTLIFTGDILDSNNKVENGVAVAIKTHYPSLETEAFQDQKFKDISRAVLAIRNPVDAIPALFRLAYHAEQEKEAPTETKGKESKATEAPLRAWLSWKSQNFKPQLDKWVEHLEWWLENYSEENLHILPFEHVMSSEKGPDELLKLRDFMKESDPTMTKTMTEPDRLPCIWKMLVGASKKNPEKDEELSKETRNLLYSKDAVDNLIQAMHGVKNKQTHPSVVKLMDEYISNIEENRKDNEEGAESLENTEDIIEGTDKSSGEVTDKSSGEVTDKSIGEVTVKSVDKNETTQDSAQCSPLKPQNKKVHPAWISSYPGSGSKIAWKLVESITGLFTGDDLDTNGNVANSYAVSIKTHFPSYTKVEVFQNERFKNIRKAVLQIRNPLNAIYAVYRFIYNVRQKQDGKDPVREPPLNEWLSWRNVNFASELNLWMKHTQWWLDNYGTGDLLILPYEHLTSAEKGSSELEKLGDFLKSVDPVVAEQMVEKEKICCIWELIVGNYIKEQAKTEKLTLDKLYSAETLKAAQDIISEMKGKNDFRPEVVALMNEYLDEVGKYKSSAFNSII